MQFHVKCNVSPRRLYLPRKMSFLPKRQVYSSVEQCRKLGGDAYGGVVCDDQEQNTYTAIKALRRTEEPTMGKKEKSKF